MQNNWNAKGRNGRRKKNSRWKKDKKWKQIYVKRFGKSRGELMLCLIQIHQGGDILMKMS